MAKLSSFKASGNNILEQVSGICDGSEITVSSGTYTLPNVTSSQTLSTSYADASGSPITYTPPSGTVAVLYEFQFQFSWSNAHCISHWKLYIDGTEVTDARNSLSGYYAENQFMLRWIFRIGSSADAAKGIVTSWDSGKILKWQAREYGTSNGLDRLHLTQYWDGGGTDEFSHPMLNIVALK